MDNTSKWRSLIRNLRKRFPVESPVRVIRLNVKGDPGLTTFNGSSYRVRIQSNQDWGGQVDAILHEWAHVCAIEEAYNHRGRWATLFGEIYDAWTKDFPTPSGPQGTT